MFIYAYICLHQYNRCYTDANQRNNTRANTDNYSESSKNILYLLKSL